MSVLATVPHAWQAMVPRIPLDEVLARPQFQRAQHRLVQALLRFPGFAFQNAKYLSRLCCLYWSMIMSSRKDYIGFMLDSSTAMICALTVVWKGVFFVLRDQRIEDELSASLV